jgi:UDPglucose 6-dehydrogenase
LGIGSDTRIGKRFLFPGIGYGGSCFPKDVKALAHSGLESGYEFKILKSVMKVNERQKTILLGPIIDFFGSNLNNVKLALWGLAFKPDTDDIREAPALYMIEHLVENGATVVAYDPEAMDNVKKLFGDKIQYAATEYEALEGADALVICTEWSAFKNPDFAKISEKLSKKAIFDGRNLYDLDKMKELGFFYKSIGRDTIGENASVNALVEGEGSRD